MSHAEFMYQCFSEYSNKSIRKLTELIEQAEDQTFSAKDIVPMCDMLLKVESELENEHSYNIDWSIKDEVVELILMLVMKNGVSIWADAITTAINKYAQISRPYLAMAIDTFLSVLIFTDTSTDKSTSIQNRLTFLKSLQKNVPDYKNLLISLCEKNISQWMESNHMTEEEVKSMAIESNNMVYGLYTFLKDQDGAPDFGNATVLQQ